MPRKRKVQLRPVEEEKENEDESTVSKNCSFNNGPMYNIMSNAQLNETFHKKYIKEMKQLYAQMDHDAFMFTFIKMIKSAMEAEETNEYAYTTLIFCAKYATSYEGEDTHKVLLDTFKWVLSTISNNPHIRFRLCQFVNLILNSLGIEAALDDAICDNILSYMMNRLRDINPHVRVQAIQALQRLQCPDNPDDTVLRAYQFHLCSDPSPKVRQSVITSMGRNYNTIPYILERLWDIDEKVRRHTYLHMSSYPAKAYKVVQRLTLLEQGLNDRSEAVKKVVTTVLIPQWLESYAKNYIMLVSALKMDANEAEVDRFQKITKQTLFEIFKRQSDKSELVSCLPLEDDGENHKCIPFDQLSLDVAFSWQCLVEYLHAESADEYDLVTPELSSFCSYVSRFCESQKVDMDKFEKMEFQYKLLSLMEIIYTFDLGDEIGRDNLKKLLANLITNYDIEEKIIQVIIRCSENLFSEQEQRLSFFVDIVKEILDSSSFKKNDLMNDRSLFEELLEKHPDKDLKLKLSSLKVKILDLEEQEMNFVEKKDYVQAQRITEEKTLCNEEYSNLLRPLLDQYSSASDESKSISTNLRTKKVTTEIIIKCLQVSFYMVISKNVKSLTPNVCELYKDFIRRHIESSQISIRGWALKCGTAYSMLYEPLAKDVYVELYSQFYKNHNVRIWKTSIECIFELLDRYGFANFELEDKANRSKKAGRTLYNTLDAIDAEEDQANAGGNGVDLIFMMSHFLDTCDDACIVSALVHGFCRLVLHGHIENADIVEKLLLKYFNPSTDPEVNQIIGVFLENLILKKKQKYLQPCLLPTVSTVLSAAYDSPLHEIKPETILRFVIDSTRPQFCSPGEKIHNTIALSFLQEMQNNIANKDLCKILSKELVSLEVSLSDNDALRNELMGFCEKLLKCELDPKALKNIADFKQVLLGFALPKPPKAKNDGEGSDEENQEDEETTQKQDNTASESTLVPETNTTTQTATEANLSVAAETSVHVEPLSAANTPTRKRNSSPQKTPTTFGRENTTTLHYLRKSLNVSIQNAANKEEEGPTRSPKIRIEARMDSDVTPAKSNATPSPQTDPTEEGVERLSQSEIIPPSPTAEEPSQVQTRRERQKTIRSTGDSTEKSVVTETTPAKTGAPQTRLNSKSASKVENPERPAKTRAGAQKRPLRLSLSPRVIITEGGEERISPLRKQMKKNSVNGAENTSTEKENINSVTSPKPKQREENQENITPPRGKQFPVIDDQTIVASPDEPKSPAKKTPKPVSDSTSTPHSARPTTRNSAKKDMLSKQIMTRKRLSLDKISTNTNLKVISSTTNKTTKVSKIPVKLRSTAIKKVDKNAKEPAESKPTEEKVRKLAATKQTNTGVKTPPVAPEERPTRSRMPTMKAKNATVTSTASVNKKTVVSSVSTRSTRNATITLRKRKV